jgi:hypothetical protein
MGEEIHLGQGPALLGVPHTSLTKRDLPIGQAQVSEQIDAPMVIRVFVYWVTFRVGLMARDLRRWRSAAAEGLCCWRAVADLRFLSGPRPPGWSGATSVWPVRAAMLGELVTLESSGGPRFGHHVLALTGAIGAMPCGWRHAHGP